MNIYAGEGHKVVVTEDTATNGYDSDKRCVNSYLEIGKAYTVAYVEVSGWSTAVYLKEVPGVAFNSVNFEDAPRIIFHRHYEEFMGIPCTHCGYHYEEGDYQLKGRVDDFVNYVCEDCGDHFTVRLYKNEEDLKKDAEGVWEHETAE